MKRPICENCGMSLLDIGMSLLNGRTQSCDHKMTTKIRVYPDGDQMCAVFSDFINLQESRSGFGKTAKEAIERLVYS